MLHNEARILLVEAYERRHDAKGVAAAFGVSVPTVYRLAEQKATTGSVDLRVNQRGRKHILGSRELIRTGASPMYSPSGTPDMIKRRPDPKNFPVEKSRKIFFASCSQVLTQLYRPVWW